MDQRKLMDNANTITDMAKTQNIMYEMVSDLVPRQDSVDERMTNIEERLNTIQEHLEGLPDIIQRCLQQHQQRVEQRHMFLHPEDAIGHSNVTTPGGGSSACQSFICGTGGSIGGGITNPFHRTPYNSHISISGGVGNPATGHVATPTGSFYEGVVGINSNNNNNNNINQISLGNISQMSSSGGHGHHHHHHNNMAAKSVLQVFPTRSASAPTNS
ncbi:potassium intermediate small conductance calcium-activated channel, sub N, member 3 [Chamberlinius hualienensis]